MAAGAWSRRRPPIQPESVKFQGFGDRVPIWILGRHRSHRRDRANGLHRLELMAGFQTSPNGWFWVSPEVKAVVVRKGEGDVSAIRNLHLPINVWRKNKLRPELPSCRLGYTFHRPHRVSPCLPTVSQPPRKQVRQRPLAGPPNPTELLVPRLRNPPTDSGIAKTRSIAFQEIDEGPRFTTGGRIISIVRHIYRTLRKVNLCLWRHLGEEADSILYSVTKLSRKLQFSQLSPRPSNRGFAACSRRLRVECCWQAPPWRQR